MKWSEQTTVIFVFPIFWFFIRFSGVFSGIFLFSFFLGSNLVWQFGIWDGIWDFWSSLWWWDRCLWLFLVSFFLFSYLGFFSLFRAFYFLLSFKIRDLRFFWFFLTNWSKWRLVRFLVGIFLLGILLDDLISINFENNLNKCICTFAVIKYSSICWLIFEYEWRFL